MFADHTATKYPEYVDDSGYLALFCIDSDSELAEEYLHRYPQPLRRVAPCLRFDLRVAPGSAAASTFSGCATAARSCIAASLRRTSSAFTACEFARSICSSRASQSLCDCAQLRSLSLSSQVRADHPREQAAHYRARHSHVRQGPLNVPQVWHLASGIWHLASGIWHWHLALALAFGIWHWHRALASGIRSSVRLEFRPREKEASHGAG